MRSRLENRQRWERTEKWLAELTSYPPSGCARCGHRDYCHFLGRPRTPADASGSHAYEHPTSNQIKTRMLARRAARHPNEPRGNTMNGKPQPDPRAIRAEILDALKLKADTADASAGFHQRRAAEPGGYADHHNHYAAHHAQVAKVARGLYTLADRGLIEHLAADDQPDDSYQSNHGEARYAWHTIRLYRGANLFDPGESDIYDQFHPAQCATLPPGAVCWFSQDPRADWWPTRDQHGTYRIRPGFQLVGGGPDGDDPDVHEFFDIQVKDESTGEWRQWNGPTVGEANAAKAVQEQQR